MKHIMNDKTEKAADRLAKETPGFLKILRTPRFLFHLLVAGLMMATTAAEAAVGGSPFYEFKVVAEEGALPLGGSTILSSVPTDSSSLYYIYRWVSVNDAGRVAFCGEVFHDIDWSGALITGELETGYLYHNNHLEGTSGGQYLREIYKFPQINNDDKVVVAREDFGSFGGSVLVYNANTAGSGTPPFFDLGIAELTYNVPGQVVPYAYPYSPSRSEDGQIAHYVQVGLLLDSDVSFSINLAPAAQLTDRTFLEPLDTTWCPPPLCAKYYTHPAAGDAGSVFKTGPELTGKVEYFSRSRSRVEIASTSGGEWEKLGEFPGITGDGKVVAFVGRKTSGEEGIFIHVFSPEDGLADSQTVLVTGTNSIIGFDDNEQPIRLKSFSYSGRIPVIRHDLGADGSIVGDSFIIAFQATPTSASIANSAPDANGAALLFSDQEGIWTTRVEIQRSYAATNNIVAETAGPLPVLQVGDWVGSPGGAMVTNLILSDGLGTGTREANGAPRRTSDQQPTASDHVLAFLAVTTGGAKVIEAWHLDTDGDGLPDHWERPGGGIDMDRDGILDFRPPRFGASELHKDLFLEIDWLPWRTYGFPDKWKTSPSHVETSALADIFRRAPVTNLDLSAGILLHIDAGSGMDKGLPIYAHSQNIGEASNSELQGGEAIFTLAPQKPDLDGKRPDLICLGANHKSFPLLTNGLVVESFHNIKGKYFSFGERQARELVFRYCVCADFLYSEEGIYANKKYTIAQIAGRTWTVDTPSGISPELLRVLLYPGGGDLAFSAQSVPAGQAGLVEIRHWSLPRANSLGTQFDITWDGPPIVPTPGAGDTFVFLNPSTGRSERQVLRQSPMLTVGSFSVADNHSWGGNDCLVTMQGHAGVPQWQHTLLHEFGHALGLHHGGTDPDCAFSGDRLWSVMSYSHQLRQWPADPIIVGGIQCGGTGPKTDARPSIRPDFFALPINGVVSSFSSGQDPMGFDEWRHIRMDSYSALSLIGNSYLLSPGAAGEDQTEPPPRDIAPGNQEDLPPVLALTQPHPPAQVATGGSLLVEGQATDDHGIDHIVLVIDVNGNGQTTNAGERLVLPVDATNRFSGTFTNFQGLTGVRTMRVEAWDNGGNVSDLAPNVMVGGSVNDSYAPEVALLKPYVPMGLPPVQLSNWLQVIIEARDYDLGTFQYIPADSVVIAFDINGDGTTNGPGETVMATPTVSNRFSVWFPDISGPTGTRYLQVRAVDKWLNVATRSFGMNVILPDPVPPILAFINPANGATVAMHRNQEVKVSASDNQGVREVKIRFDGNGDGTLDEVMAYSNFDGTYSATLTAISGPPGPRTITAVARDIALNETIVTRTVNVALVDLADPAVAILTPLEAAAVGTNTTLTVSFQGTDDDAVAAMSVSFDIDGDGQTTGPGETVNFNPSWFPQSYGATANFYSVRGALGPRVITVKATDTSGKTNSIRRTVNVTSALVVPFPRAGDRVPQSSTLVVQVDTSSAVTPASLQVRFDANGDGDTTDPGETIAPIATVSASRWVASFSDITGPLGQRQVRVDGAVPGSAAQNVTLLLEVTDGGDYPGTRSQKLAAVPFLPEIVTNTFGQTMVWSYQGESPLVFAGQKLFFVPHDGGFGSQPWTSDGTRRGTFLLRDISPTAPGEPQQWAGYRDEVFFAASDGPSPEGHGVELWASDGSPGGTRLVKDIRPRGYRDGVESSQPRALQVFSNQLFFVAEDGLLGSDASIHGSELWVSDGTGAGTSVFKDIEPGAGGAVSTGGNRGPLVVSNTLFIVSNPKHQLWKSDGTVSGTVMVKDFGLGYNIGACVSTRRLLFFAMSYGNSYPQLWRSDGTDAGTIPLRGFNFIEWQKTDRPSQPAELADRLIFAADDGVSGTELWQSDGTPGGTALVKDIYSGTNGSAPTYLTAYDGQVYFSANDRWHGRELWRTDGSEAGTVLAVDIGTYNGSPGSPYPFADSDPQYLTVFNGLLYFSADDALGIYGRELWRSDGTTAGTVLVADIAPGGAGSGTLTYSSDPRHLMVCSGELYFSASDSYYSWDLWKSDGTSQGTTRVRNLSHSLGGPLARLPNGVAFAAKDPAHGFGLWAATSDGTRFLTNGGAGMLSSAPQYLGSASGKAVYAIQGGTVTVWATDGTLANTVRLGSGSFYAVAKAAQLGNLLLFTATDNNGEELWKTDGTPGGTRMVKDIYPGYGSSSPKSFFPFQCQLYFQANDGVTGIELWKTDGSSAGTVLVANLNPGAGSSSPDHFIVLNNQLVFWADDGAHGREPWLADGITAPRLIKDIWPGSIGSEYYQHSANIGATEPYPRAVMNGVLYFRADNGSGQGIELWRTDGTAAGTQMVRRLGYDFQGSMPGQFTVANNTLFFNAALALGVNGLWRSDGTSNGTFVVASAFVRSGAFGGSGTWVYPDSLRAVDCQLYFVFLDDHGWELWRSDGTTNGTFRLKDIRVGAASSDIGEMAAMNSLLYFVADDGEHGRELWQTDGTTIGTQMVEDLLPGPESANPAYLTATRDGLCYFANDGGDDVSLRWLATGGAPGAVGFQISLTCANTVVVAWPSLWEGWILQENTDSVTSANWSNVMPCIIQDDGLTKTLTVDPPTGNRFYRLFRP